MKTSLYNEDPLTPHFYIVKHRLWVLVKTPLEAFLTCTHNLSFDQKFENSKINATENCHFYSSEKWMYIAWARFRNAEVQMVVHVLKLNKMPLLLKKP